MATPFLATSVTVVGTAVQRWNNGTSNFSITIPEGVYWVDGLNAGGSLNTSNIFVQLGALLTAADPGPNTWTLTGKVDFIGGVDTYQTQVTVTGGGTAEAKLNDATTTQAGKDLGRRMGIDTLSADPSSPSALVVFRQSQGAWRPNRDESVDIDITRRGFGSMIQAYDGTTYDYNLGDDLKAKMLRMNGMPQAAIRSRNTVIDSEAVYDGSFETLIWRWLARGEKLRYYADDGKMNFLDAAMTATDTTATVNATNTANGDAVCIDGEWARILSGGGTTTLTLYREEPVAHTLGSPVGVNSFAGTFSLGMSGGNCNKLAFRPQRRASNDDRWDIEVPLIQGPNP